MSTKLQNEATEWIRAGRQKKKKKLLRVPTASISSSCRQHCVEMAPGPYLRSVQTVRWSVSDVHPGASKGSGRIGATSLSSPGQEC